MSYRDIFYIRLDKFNYCTLRIFKCINFIKINIYYNNSNIDKFLLENNREGREKKCKENDCYIFCNDVMFEV